MKRQKADDKFSSATFQKLLSYEEFKFHGANSVDSDEVAHDEPPHVSLCCL